MERERILAMDPYILLSWTNMKLRDYFNSLERLCDEFNLNYEDFSAKLNNVGYFYNRETNQFTSV